MFVRLEETNISPIFRDVTLQHSVIDTVEKYNKNIYI